ncbi:MULTISPECIES: carboxypeptidase regulatory-like domain-containing protein [unclassified Chryseobacterium]|uniref:carboxypeptidase regulatory-like domain-containing protein n=1 Tax=unclassified Chryseobacterium TaxID=2593645 RepID=UPI0022699C8E|nr:MULTISPECIES: carboxypeptidase regulatory-like domain-containing protein [unclassified Chryseobacterium]
MMKLLFAITALFFFESVFSQQQISGKITDENDFRIPSVLVVNITKNKQSYSNSVGEFSIEASKNDQIRFIKDNYERISVRVVLDGNVINQHIVMTKTPKVIEEVKIVKLSGDLSKDSQKFAKEDKAWEIQRAIGLPKPPEIMREKVPTIHDIFTYYIFSASIDIDVIYKLISGDARRMKNIYKFDDRERNIKWLTDRISADYFTEAGIPQERIKEFLGYSFGENSQILLNIKKKNINAAIFEIDKTIPKFVERLKTNQ